MNTIRMTLTAGLLVLGAVISRADESAPKADSSLEIIQYKMPAGWKAANSPGQPVRVLTSPDSNGAAQAVILLMVSPPQDGQELAAAFKTAIERITADGKVTESSDAISSKTRQGYDAISKTLVIHTAAGQDVHARMVAAKVNNRIAGIYYVASNQAMYDQHQGEMAALLQSVSFADAAANPLGANPLGANALGANTELAALEKQKQELLAKIAEIESREKQLAGNSSPAAGGGATAQDDLLAKAREAYLKGLAARRKPHTISGDILALDGKPIANVVSYRVYVWGTTIAAERTSYGLEVDQNGHFEQQVPDGLYQLEAHCIVNQAGHRVPVDLVWLDDRKMGVVQASAGGIVRDFRLVLNGLRPGEDPKSNHAYFGGSLRVDGPAFDLRRGSFSVRHPGARVLLTLTAQTAMVDGSKMDPIIVNMDVSELNYSSTRRNIPVGVYKASAVLVGKDGTKTQLPCASNFNGPFGESAEIFWESSRDNQEQRNERAIFLKD